MSNNLIKPIINLPDIKDLYTGVLLEKFEKVLSECNLRIRGMWQNGAIVKDGVRYCVWCGKNVLHRRNQKYCSKLCSDSCFIFHNPQQNAAMQILLIKQNLKCNICGYDYLPHILSVQKKIDDKIGLSKLNYYLIFLFKRSFSKNKLRRPEVDHIIPIAAGGQSLGLDNHQLICNKCHKEKTKSDFALISQYKKSIKIL